MLTRLKQDLTMADAARTHGGARVDLVAVSYTHLTLPTILRV